MIQRSCMYSLPVLGPGEQEVRPVDTERPCLTECKVGKDDRSELSKVLLAEMWVL